MWSLLVWSIFAVRQTRDYSAASFKYLVFEPTMLYSSCHLFIGRCCKDGVGHQCLPCCSFVSHPRFYVGQLSLCSTMGAALHVYHVYDRFPRQHRQRQCFEAIVSTTSRGTTRHRQTTAQTQSGARLIGYESAQADRCGWQRYNTRLSSCHRCCSCSRGTLHSTVQHFRLNPFET